MTFLSDTRHTLRTQLCQSKSQLSYSFLPCLPRDLIQLGYKAFISENLQNIIMSREKVTSSKSRQSLTREVFIFKCNVVFLVGCQISLYRLQTSNILILIFSPQYSQLHIIPGRSSVRYLFCRQARQAIFLSQCFPFVPSLKREERKLNTSNLYFSIKKTN